MLVWGGPSAQWAAKTSNWGWAADVFQRDAAMKDMTLRGVLGSSEVLDPFALRAVIGDYVSQALISSAAAAASILMQSPQSAV